MFHYALISDARNISKSFPASDTDSNIELLYLQVWLYVQAQGQLDIVLALRYNRVGRLFIAAVSELYPPAATTLRRVKQREGFVETRETVKAHFLEVNRKCRAISPQPPDSSSQNAVSLGQVSSLL